METTSEQPEPDVVKVSILNEESIIIGFYLTDYLVKDLLSNFPASTYAIITDTIIASIHLEKLLNRFESAATELIRAKGENVSVPRFLTYAIPPGEESKTRETKAKIEDYLLSEACTRDTFIIAFGGGVIGDLVGFTAATFMRGVPFAQIPTTLLAMVDASIGGKTAVDTPHGKNLIGAFWQPKRIYIDLVYLETLPERQFINGMGEVIKSAAIWSENDFVNLENNVESIRSALKFKREVSFQGATVDTRTPGQSLLLSVIVGAVKFKAHVVTNDEKESGLREILNFGHGIGHAIETILSPEMLHGECISIGMVKEAEIARNLGYLNQVTLGRLIRCLQNYGLPVSYGEKKVLDLVGDKHEHVTVDRLMTIMKVDKKNRNGQKRIVLLGGIGKVNGKKATVVSDSVIHKILSPAIIVHPVEPSSDLKEHVTIKTPGSKSISNRALILASLGIGTCRLKGLLHSDDTQVMLSALMDLEGAKFEWEDDGETLVVTGGGGNVRVPNREIYLGNAGTAARFITTVCTLISPDSTTEEKKHTILTGNARMKQRPIGPLVDALRENGSQIKYLESDGCLPLEITPGEKSFRGGTINLAASISSQYVSSILLSAPYASEPVTLKLTGGQVISQPFIDMTIAMMESFGIKVERLDDDVYRIPQGHYKNPEIYMVESDASSSTYPLAIAAVTGTSCTLPNIGSSSLQGDAAFAVKVIRQMGCKVTQTPTSTTVQGPPIGSLKPLPNIDMESMTDAFLTASVLAAVASSQQDGEECVTRITGIANQRLKECNRIAAMIDELSKFGVVASELPDGIQIHGSKIDTLRGPTEGVHCYDDHRVAMSFSVLGCVVPGGTIIREKQCVDKTWPGWWDVLESKLSIKLEGLDLVPRQNDFKKVETTISPYCLSEQDASILFIGMRGAGKTYLGKAAAKALGRKYVDADHHFETTLSTTIPEFISKHGWEAFREKEFELLSSLLKMTSGCIISCGGGIVETPSSRNLLKEYIRKKGKVIHIVRDIKEIVKYLNTDTIRPAYGEDIYDVWRRREGWYKECSNYEFVAITVSSINGVTDEDIVQREWKLVERFLRFISGFTTDPIDTRSPRRSFFVSLTFPDITPALNHIPAITYGVDAIELRVDLLTQDGSLTSRDVNDVPSTDYVAQQLALIRRSSTLPIIFTVRSKGQGGRFPDNRKKEMFVLLGQAIKWGCEYIDLEIGGPSDLISNLISNKGYSKIIASWHDVSMRWDGEEIRKIFRTAQQYGDIIKLVGRAESIIDNFKLQEFVQSLHAENSKPIIAINMGEEGQLSRVLNKFLTPVTHPLLPSKAAAGQLSVREINQALHLIGQLPKKKYFVFGTPIRHSMSPTMHNTGFLTLGLPHVYDLFESQDVEAVKPILEDPEFGGASVTIPHKLSIMSYVDELTEHAKSIGAVNTIIVKDDDSDGRKLIGDNTDWLGIFHLIKPLIEVDSNTSALIIGAGGTSRAALYAVNKLGVEHIYMYNRTPVKVDALTKEFPDYRIQPIASLSQQLPVTPQIIVSTVPATANLEIPDDLLKFDQGVCVEMAYRPRITDLIKKCKSRGWHTIEGIQVLMEQGFWQFEAWTGRRAPREIIEEEVMKSYES
ncbi:3719_t:CDS:1, partial [Acaulospora colombiana]